MGLRDASERIKKHAEELKEEVRGTAEGLGESLPRPLMERKTVILKEPLVKIISRRVRDRK
ncbi:MAG: hypothetical protein D4S01_10605 [Dehalococcoidia bacterium]|nr:MAG: hypothetical protein D4S01_10605 [Dehalococcoidia bacterium]